MILLRSTRENRQQFATIHMVFYPLKDWHQFYPMQEREVLAGNCQVCLKNIYQDVCPCFLEFGNTSLLTSKR